MMAVLLAAALSAQSLKAEHVEIKQHLAHVTQWTGELAKAADKRAVATKILAFFEQHIRPHAEAEEREFYPRVDELAKTGDANRYTSSMRHEHVIVGRWTGELAAELRTKTPDYGKFARRADNLLGLITAHFEEEEEVLLPWLGTAH